MKKINFIIIMLAMLLAVSCEAEEPIDEEEEQLTYSDAWDGEQTTKPTVEDGYYLIESASDLAWFGKDDPEILHNIKFTTNVDMGDKQFDGIKSFTNMIDGNGKSITNLKIENATNAGLVLTLGDGGVIKNLTILGGSTIATTNNGKSVAGAFVASVFADANVTLSGLTNKAAVKGYNIVGGILGQKSGDGTATITDIKNSGDIEANGSAPKAGGIIGEVTLMAILKIDNAENEGDVKASGSDSSAGGIIGDGTVGAILTINNVENKGNVDATDTISKAGGIIGNLSTETTISLALNSGSIEGVLSAGGIIGYVPIGGKMLTIDNTGNAGSLRAEEYAGGVIGYINSTVAANAKITESYNYEVAIDAQSIGGIIGNAANSVPELNKNIYNNGAGGIKAIGNKASTSGSTEQTLFKNESTFSSWTDFSDVWEITNDKYPTLKK